jgi:hypothetical protein
MSVAIAPAGQSVCKSLSASGQAECRRPVHCTVMHQVPFNPRCHRTHGLECDRKSTWLTVRRQSIRHLKRRTRRNLHPIRLRRHQLMIRRQGGSTVTATGDPGDSSYSRCSHRLKMVGNNNGNNPQEDDVPPPGLLLLPGPLSGASRNNRRIIFWWGEGESTRWRCNN